MIFDLEKMSSCNDKWIFYKDDTRRAITHDMVPEILRYLTGELGYYSRLHDDFKKRYTDTMEKLESLPIPDSKYFEDCAIIKYPFMECVKADKLKQKRDTLRSECDTYAKIITESRNKCYHYKQCMYRLTGSQW